eukprot:755024-Hanusia_phi.AAC.3
MAKGKKSQPAAAKPDPPVATQSDPPAGERLFFSNPFSLAHSQFKNPNPLLLRKAVRRSLQQVLACAVVSLPLTGGPDVPAISAEALKSVKARFTGEMPGLLGSRELLMTTKKRMADICQADCPVLTSWPARNVIEPSNVKQTPAVSPHTDPLSMLLYPIADAKPVEQMIAEQLKFESGFLDYPLGSEVPEARGKGRRGAS